MDIVVAASSVIELALFLLNPKKNGNIARQTEDFFFFSGKGPIEGVPLSAAVSDGGRLNISRS